MAYIMTGVQAMFPIQLARKSQQAERTEDYDVMVAQNENSLNQNFNIIYQKLMEMEEQLNGR